MSNVCRLGHLALFAFYGSLPIGYWRSPDEFCREAEENEVHNRTSITICSLLIAVHYMHCWAFKPGNAWPPLELLRFFEVRQKKLDQLPDTQGCSPAIQSIPSFFLQEHFLSVGLSSKFKALERSEASIPDAVGNVTQIHSFCTWLFARRLNFRARTVLMPPHIRLPAKMAHHNSHC